MAGTYVIETSANTLRRKHQVELLRYVHCDRCDDTDLSWFGGEHMPALVGLRIDHCEQLSLVADPGAAHGVHFPVLSALHIENARPLDLDDDDGIEFSGESFPALTHLHVRSIFYRSVRIHASLCANLKALRLCHVIRLHLEGFRGVLFPSLLFMELTGSAADLSPLEDCELPVLDKFSYCCSFYTPLRVGAWPFRLPALTRLRLSFAKMDDSCFSE